MFTVTKYYLVTACKTNLTFVVNKCPVNLVWLWHYLTSLIHSSHCHVISFLPACMKVIYIYWLRAKRRVTALVSQFFWQMFVPVVVVIITIEPPRSFGLLGNSPMLYSIAKVHFKYQIMCKKSTSFTHSGQMMRFDKF